MVVWLSQSAGEIHGGFAFQRPDSDQWEPRGFTCLRYHDPAWQRGTLAAPDSEVTLFVPFHYFYFIETGSCLVGQTGLELSILPRAGRQVHTNTPSFLSHFYLVFLQTPFCWNPSCQGYLKLDVGVASHGALLPIGCVYPSPLPQ